MIKVAIHLPSILESLTGTRIVTVSADSVGGALTALTTLYPALKLALFDEQGSLREHVLCFHNKENTRWHAQGLAQALSPGDHLTIIQAVAGG